MALKDWKKVKNNKWKNIKSRKALIIRKIFNKHHVDIENRIGYISYINLNITKTKSQALKFAKLYMKKH